MEGGGGGPKVPKSQSPKVPKSQSPKVIVIYCIYIAQIPYIICSNAHYTIHIYTLNIFRVLFWRICSQSRNIGASPFSFTISVLGSFTCITQHTGPTALRPDPKDEAIMVKCLAQGHKRRDRPGRDSNSQHQNLSPMH